MAKQPAVVKTRTRIPSDWQPSPDDCAYAGGKGITDIASVTEEFRDHHLAHGSVMLDWHAAWRTWCRNSIKFGRPKGRPALPLEAAMHDPADAYGARAFAARLADAERERMADGSKVMCINGFDVAGTAADACEAAGLTPDWRGELMHIAWWLRDGATPEHIVAVIRSSPRPRELGAWWWYDQKVSGRQRLMPKAALTN